MDDSQIATFFRDYGEALGRDDPVAISGFYAEPALVVDDKATVSVLERGDVRAAFEGSAEIYAAKKLIGARAQVDGVDRLSERLAFVAVTWEYLDTDGGAQPGESYRYLVRLGDKPAICVVVPVA